MLEDDAEDWEEGAITSPSPKDLLFDQWVTINESSLSVQLEKIASQILNDLAPKNRKPRSDLVQGINDIVSTIIANLVILHRDKPDGYRLAVPMERRKKTQYDRKGFRKLPEVVNALAAQGHVIKHDAVFKERRTTIETAGKLREVLKAVDARDDPISRVAGEETIQLTARPKRKWVGGRKQPKLLIDYQDTEETIRLRREMEEINRFLSSHSIVLEGAPETAFRLVRRFTLRQPEDPHELKFHGRLYGGFWMTLKATERHRILIDGEPIADLDFASMFPRLSYLAVGETPPDGDLYAVPGLEDHRDGAKAGLSALLSYKSRMKSLPTKLKSMLPEGWTASRLRLAFSEFHPLLVPCFEKDFGLELMFTESRILLSAMFRLMDEGIPALPMHDGMMVPLSKVSSGIDAMKHASESEIGFCLPTTKK